MSQVVEGFACGCSSYYGEECVEVLFIENLRPRAIGCSAIADIRAQMLALLVALLVALLIVSLETHPRFP